MKQGWYRFGGRQKWRPYTESDVGTPFMASVARSIAIIGVLLVAALPAVSAFAQDATPAMPDAALAEMRALAAEARIHAEDAGRYAEDASSFLGIFEALGLSVTVGGALLAAFGVLRLLSAQSELTKTRDEVVKELGEIRQQFEQDLRSKEAELDMLNQQLRMQAEASTRAAAETTSRATLALSLLPLGERQYRAQDFDGAIQTYKRALELDDRNPVTHLRIGYVYTQSGKLEEARFHLNRAMDIEPNFPNAMAALGFVHRRIGEKLPPGLDKDAMLNEGEGHMIQALKISPMLIDDDGESWWGALGGLYRRRGQIDQAIYAYERAAEITPHSSYPFSNLALLYMEKENREKMMATFRRVERLADGETQAEVDNYWGYADLLTSRLALGKTDEAEHALQSVIDIAPEDSPYVLTMLIDTLTRLTKAMGGEAAASHIAPIIDRLQKEVAAREARGKAT
jgi:tetratricopeptide (TPR) repeat protein